MKTALSFIAGISLLTLAGTAGAQEPIQLTEVQLDKVTAGVTATVITLGASAAVGDITALSAAATLANANTIAPNPVLAQGVVTSGALAVSAYNPLLPNVGAHAASAAAATASLGNP